MKPIPAVENFQEAAFPARGVDLSQAFGLQLAGTTPSGLNVRWYEAQTQRGRGGSRSGLSKYLADQIPEGSVLIQHLNIVVDPTNDATLDEDDGTFPDPSDAGPSRAWGIFHHSRNPGRNIRQGGTGRMRIKNKPVLVTVTATDQSKNVGSTLTFSGTEFNTSGLIGGDTITSCTITSTGAVSTAAAGSYEIKIRNAQGSFALNKYKFKYNSGTLSVVKIALSITANNQSKTFGNLFTFAGTEFTSSGLVGGDSISSCTISSTGAAASAAVGSYVINIAAPVGLPANKYNVTFHTGTMTVASSGLPNMYINATGGDYDALGPSPLPSSAVPRTGSAWGTAWTVTHDAGPAFTITGVDLACSNNVAFPDMVLDTAFPITASGAVGTGLAAYTIIYNDAGHGGFGQLLWFLA